MNTETIEHKSSVNEAKSEAGFAASGLLDAVCRNCKWWDKIIIDGVALIAPPIGETGWDRFVGYCRRYAPKGDVPKMMENEWCGEFERSKAVCEAYWKLQASNIVLGHTPAKPDNANEMDSTT